MRSLVKILAAAVLVMGPALSCSRSELDRLAARGEGMLSIVCGLDMEVIAVTRAEGEETVLQVTVTEAETGKVVASVDDHRTLAGSPLVLKAGQYDVRAFAGTGAVAAFDAPYYEGTTTVDVVAGEDTQAELTCTLANVKVTVSRSEIIENSFSAFSVAVSNGQEAGTLEFKDETLSKEGYFPCSGTLTWVLSLTSNDGRSYTLSDDITGVRPREHYNIHFDMDSTVFVDMGAVTSIKVTIDGTFNETEHMVTIPIEKAPEPVITESTGIDLSQPVTSLILSTADVESEGIGLFRAEAQAGFRRVVLGHSADTLIKLGVPDSLNLVDPAVTIAYGAAAKAAGITWSEAASGDKSMNIDLREMLRQFPVGSYSLTLSVLDLQRQYVVRRLDITLVPDMEVQTDPVNLSDVWARHATVSARYNTATEPAGMTFQYRRAGEEAWTEFPADGLVKDGTAFSAVLTGLEPATEYEVRAITAAEQKDENIQKFTTEAAEQLPNFNFDDWSKNGDSWSPNANAGNAFWDSGNEGANSKSDITGVNNPTSPSDFVAPGTDSKQSAKLESMFISFVGIGKFAGGNIYTGDFITTVGTSGAKLTFGRPYNSRPAKLKGWYCYAPKQIDKAEGIHADKKGTTDVGKIFVALLSSAVDVDNSENILFDPNADYVIGYGELEDNVGTEGEYKQFEIELEYRKDKDGKVRRPTHVLVVATASAYADYFTGGVGSTLYIDEFEFIFE